MDENYTQTIEYITDMASQLQKMAKAEEHSMLALLLEMVAEEGRAMLDS